MVVCRGEKVSLRRLKSTLNQHANVIFRTYTGPKTKDLLQMIATEDGLDEHITHDIDRDYADVNAV